MKAAELLERIARTLRSDVGPAVDAEYPKTQAYMAAVVLQKLGRQLALADAHRAADAADLRALAADLVRQKSVPGTVAPEESDAWHRIDAFAAAPDAATLCGVIDALYGARGEIGAARIDAMLGRIRATLRAQIDRRLHFAK